MANPKDTPQQHPTLAHYLVMVGDTISPRDSSCLIRALAHVADALDLALDMPADEGLSGLAGVLSEVCMTLEAARP